MTDQIITPPGSGDELLTVLTRIAAALERLADSAIAANCINEDSNRYLCSTIASLHDFEPNKPKPTKGRGRA